MTESDVWFTIFLLAVATILTRGCAFSLFGNGMKMPAKVQHALRYAPAAALAAIVAPDLMLSGSAVGMTLMNPKLIAGVGAALFFVTTRHLLGTIIAGMALFTVLRLVL